MSQDDDKELDSPDLFSLRYKKVLAELEVVHKGVYDSEDANQMAAMTLLARTSLAPLLTDAEAQARGTKRWVKVVEAQVYHELKSSGNKITEAALEHSINKDDRVQEAFNKYNEAEKKAKELSIILGVLEDAHLTFRAMVKKAN